MTLRYSVDFANSAGSLHDYLNDVAKWLRTHDIVIGNLETPFVDTEFPAGAKSAHICSNPANVEILPLLNVTHVTLANNRIADFGRDAIVRTEQLLKDVQVAVFGIGGRQVRIMRGDNRLCLQGYCSYNTNPISQRNAEEQQINMLSYVEVARNLHTSNQDGFFNILAVHSGQEHVPTPSIDDIDFARGLAQQMNYVYYGHHPHVIQGAECHNNSHIFYSLGNFLLMMSTLTDQKTVGGTGVEDNKTGLVVSLEIQDSKVLNVSLVPTYLGKDSFLHGEAVGKSEIKERSEMLSLATLDRETYCSNRAAKISEFLQSRKKKRDLSWYLKRLNLGFPLQLILASRRNAKNYKQKFKRYLHRHTS